MLLRMMNNTMSGPDTTLLWCLEHLAASPYVPYSALYQLIGQVRLNTSRENPIPAPLHCRLLLCGLSNSQEVTPEMLHSLVGVDNIVTSHIEEFDQNAVPYLLASSELHLQVVHINNLTTVLNRYYREILQLPSFR